MVDLAFADTGFCRDCLILVPDRTDRCPSCTGPRIVRHPELPRLSIAHIDCDAFYAAIEKRDDPSLRDRPVLIGGGRRGVVSTACYIARIHGVRSAMPMYEALRRCPEAVVLRPDMEKYAAVGREIRTLMLELTPLVEPLSIDEAFLDLTGTARLHGAMPAITLARLQRRIEERMALTVSVGLSYNKFLAKVASDMDKPRGFVIIGRAEALAFLKSRPVGIIWGVGQALRKRLSRDGITTVGALQGKDKEALMARYGQIGGRLYHLSRGQDDRPVLPGGAAKSISAETTFETDIASVGELDRILWALSRKVSRRLKRANLGGSTVILKLKTADFRTRTRNTRLNEPTQLAERIHACGRRLLRREADGTPFRLLGIGVSALVGAECADLSTPLDPPTLHRAAAERAMDRLREKFGDDILDKGLGFTPRPTARTHPSA